MSAFDWMNDEEFLRVLEENARTPYEKEAAQRIAHLLQVIEELD